MNVLDAHSKASKELKVVLLGLGTEFRSEKIPRNRPGMVSVIPRKKALIPWHSEFRVTKQQQNNLTK